MVRVEKIEVTDEKATYKYFPEGSSNFGIISLFRKTGKRHLEKELPGYDRKYYCKAMHQPVDDSKSGIFPQSGIVDWY